MVKRFLTYLGIALVTHAVIMRIKPLRDLIGEDRFPNL